MVRVFSQSAPPQKYDVGDTRYHPYIILYPYLVRGSTALKTSKEQNISPLPLAPSGL